MDNVVAIVVVVFGKRNDDVRLKFDLYEFKLVEFGTERAIEEVVGVL